MSATRMDFVRPALLALLLGTGCASPRPGKEMCGREKGARAWTYCISRPEAARSNGVIYYLHGGGGNERSWFEPENYPRTVEAEWEGGLPAVATISFGPYWLLDAELTTALVREVLPAIEAKLGAAPLHRYLVGESMGGFNASQLLLHHGKLFDRIALLCPGIMAINPDASPEEVRGFAARTGGDVGKINKILGMMRAAFSTAKAWEDDSPLLNAEKVPDLNALKLYVSCGRKDEFGFFDGAERFAALARQKGAAVVWDPLDGGHCTVAPRSLSRFLSEQ